MITELLGRFFRHCIEAAEAPPRGVRIEQYDPEFMSDAEIDCFLRGNPGKINWDRIKLRRRLGLRQDPWPPAATPAPGFAGDWQAETPAAQRPVFGKLVDSMETAR